MRSTFGEILRELVEKTAGAVGGALAAGDGETVDYWTTQDKDEWHLLTAHFGIIVSHMRRSFHTFHFGDIQFVHMGLQELDVAVQLVDGEYYVALAMVPPVRLGQARWALAWASKRLREEMG